jgi:hypothetical protein
MRRVVFLLALLACVTPAQADRIGIIPLDNDTFDAILEIGYYIRIKNDGPIRVRQVPHADNPYQTYSGCLISDVECNFNAQLSVSAQATSVAGGQWEATVSPDICPSGTTTVEICVQGKGVQVQHLVGGQVGIKVAEVTIQVVPIGN